MFLLKKVLFYYDANHLYVLPVFVFWLSFFLSFAYGEVVYSVVMSFPILIKH